jgi:hypothetical protein
MADSHVPQRVVSTPRCIGCGFTVEKKGDVCAECAMKPQFRGLNPEPIGSIVTAPQKEPPYVRQGNFARPTQQVDEDAL